MSDSFFDQPEIDASHIASDISEKHYSSGFTDKNSLYRWVKSAIEHSVTNTRIVTERRLEDAFQKAVGKTR